MFHRYISYTSDFFYHSRRDIDDLQVPTANTTNYPGGARDIDKTIRRGESTRVLLSRHPWQGGHDSWTSKDRKGTTFHVRSNNRGWSVHRYLGGWKRRIPLVCRKRLPPSRSSQAEPSQAKPRQAKPSQDKPSQVKQRRRRQQERLRQVPAPPVSSASPLLSLLSSPGRGCCTERTNTPKKSHSHQAHRNQTGQEQLSRKYIHPREPSSQT